MGIVFTCAAEDEDVHFLGGVGYLLGTDCYGFQNIVRGRERRW